MTWLIILGIILIPLAVWLQRKIFMSYGFKDGFRLDVTILRIPLTMFLTSGNFIFGIFVFLIALIFSLVMLVLSIALKLTFFVCFPLMLLFEVIFRKQENWFFIEYKEKNN